MSRLDGHGRRVALYAGLALIVVAIVVVPWAYLGRSQPSLSDAVEAGDLRRASALLGDGADPDEPRVFGLTPLMRAVVRDDVAMVELLLDAGASPGATAPEGLELTHLAAQANAVDVLQLLLRRGADPESRSVNGMNALDHAAALGNAEAIVLLVSSGVDPDVSSDVVAQGHGYPRDRGGTPLMIAVRAGEPDAVEALLASGADVNARSASGNNALLVAVWTDQSPELVETLLRHGADASVVAACDEACSAPEGDALHWAEQLDRFDLVPVLVEHAGRG